MQYTQENLCWRLFLTFLKKDSNTVISFEYLDMFKNSFFFIEHLWWLLLTVLSQYSEVSWDVCSLILHLHVLSILIKNLQKKLHK